MGGGSRRAELLDEIRRIYYSFATETGMGDRRPGEEERITADQSKQQCPFPMKAPPKGLSLFRHPGRSRGSRIIGFFSVGDKPRSQRAQAIAGHRRG
jgi:hypothetical protein